MAVENESETPVYTIKIEAGEKYILVIDFPEDAAVELASDISENAKEMLDRWQRSDDQFVVIALWGGLKVRVERIPDGND